MKVFLAAVILLFGCVGAQKRCVIPLDVQSPELYGPAIEAAAKWTEKTGCVFVFEPWAIVKAKTGSLENMKPYQGLTVHHFFQKSGNTFKTEVFILRLQDIPKEESRLGYRLSQENILIHELGYVIHGRGGLQHAISGGCAEGSISGELNKMTIDWACSGEYKCNGSKGR